MTASPLLAALLLALVAFSLSQTYNVTSLIDDDTIWVGHPMAYGNGSSFEAFSLGMNISFTMWMENANARGGIHIGNRTFKVGLRVVLVGAKEVDPEKANIATETRNLCLGKYGRVDFIFATYSSAYAAVVAAAAEPYGVPSISGHSSDESTYRCTYTDAARTKLPAGCYSEGARRYNWAISVQSKANNYLPGFLQIAKLKNAKTIGLFYENSSFSIAIAQGVRATASELGMPVLFDTIVNRHIGQLGVEGSRFEKTTLNVTDENILNNLTDTIIRLDPDAVVGGTYYDLCRNLLVKFKERNYVPRAVGMTTCMSVDLLEDLGSTTDYVMGAVGWDYRLKGTQFTETNTNPIFHWTVVNGSTLTSSEQFRLAFMNHWLNPSGSEPVYQSAGAYVVGYALHETLRKAQSLVRQDWLPHLWSLQINTIYGPLTLDTSGINYAKEFITLQVDGNVTQQIVAPLSSATLEAVYPIPPWSDRVFEYVPYGRPHEIAIVIITAVLCLLTIILMALLFFWRRKPQILASSILFCELILFGGLLSFVSLFFWSVWVTPATCIMHSWFIVVGMDLLLGSLLIKNWRIQRIFNAASSLKVTTITNFALLRAVGIILVVDLVILIIWHVAFTPTTELVVPNPYRPTLNYYLCTSTVPVGLQPRTRPVDVEEGFIGALGAYKGLQLLAGVVMAYLLRHTPSAFNEAKYIGYALYNMFFCLILLLLIWQLIPSSELVLGHALRSIVILWGIAVSLGAIFIPKVYFVLTGAKDPKKMGTTPTHSMHPTTHQTSSASNKRKESAADSSSVTDRADLRLQIVNLQKENEELRLELSKKKTPGEPRKEPEVSPAQETKPAPEPEAERLSQFGSESSVRPTSDAATTSGSGDGSGSSSGSESDPSSSPSAASSESDSSS